MVNNIKQKISNEKGVTLAALVITVVVMLIIAGISIAIGIESLDETRLKGFYMHLETIQKRADDIATTNEKYKDSTGTLIDLKTAGGKDLTSTQAAFVQRVLGEQGVSAPVDEFRYFRISDIEEQLDLIEMDYNVFIHFDTRTIIAEEGININGRIYYMLESDMYFPEEDTVKNEGILDLTYSIAKYGKNNYKITVYPNQIGDLTTNGTLRYKKITTKYWETANGLEIIISDLTQYNIEYVDRNQNMISETITVSLDDDENPIVTVDE